MVEHLSHSPGLTRQQLPTESLLHRAIQEVRKPLVAAVLALSSAGIVGIGAYPEKRMVQHEGVEEAIDRLYFTVASLTTTSTEINPVTMREKICWMIGVLGLWGTGAVTLTGLLQQAKKFAERLEKQKPMTETRFLLDPMKIDREGLARQLTMNGYSCRELVSVHLPEQEDGMEIKFQSVGRPDVPSEVKLRVKMPSGDKDGSNFIHTYLFEVPTFGTELMKQCSKDSGTSRSHKLRWSKRSGGGRDIHVDLYINDEEVVLRSQRSERPITIEVVQQLGDRDIPLDLLPEFLRAGVICPIDVTDRQLGSMWPEQVIEAAYPCANEPMEAVEFFDSRRKVLLA